MTRTEKQQNKYSYHLKIYYFLITNGYGRIWTETDTKKAALKRL